MKATIYPKIKPEKIKLPYSVSGIYFLYYEEELVYIGKGKRMGCRIIQHIHDYYNHFQEQLDGARITKVTYFTEHPNKIKEVELALIKKHKPRLNISHNTQYFKPFDFHCYTCGKRHKADEGCFSSIAYQVEFV